jgi:4-hydroxy-4-methyl-2-oxoglutarate aldolase
MTGDAELFTTIREHLFSAVIGDILDAGGLTRQFLPPTIRPLIPGPMLVGRAMPALEANLPGAPLDAAERTAAFGLMFAALDSLKAGDVYVTSGASLTFALWGGLMSTRASKLGAAGAVLDGFHRDTKEVLQVGLPVFSHGAYAQDQRVRGRVVDYNCQIEFANGVILKPGDIVVGDIDGVVIIPNGHARDVVAGALDKVRKEAVVREMIGRGQSAQSIFNSTGTM